MVAWLSPDFENSCAARLGLIADIVSGHTSGVSGWQQKMTWSDIFDFEKATALLAQQKVWWEPGTASGYHSMNMGHLVGAVVQRVTGKSLKEFVAEEIAGPLGADFQIGAKEQDWSRISNVIPPPPVRSAPGVRVSRDSVMYKTFANPPVDARIAHTPEWRHADIGAANGHANARSVARMLSPISLGVSVKLIVICFSCVGRFLRMITSR